MNNGKNIVIKYSFIRKIALIYITLPLLCFFIGWLKIYFAIPAVIALIICLAFSYIKNKEDSEDSISVSKWFIFFLTLISFFYCFLCGIGRLWAQSKDYPWRNAIFRDIILRDWPVKYPKYDGALVYYIGLWLPPSILGKISIFFGANNESAFTVGNIALLIYSALGISILFLLILVYLKPKQNKHLYLAVIMFIFFSGMDILGSIEPLGANYYHLEWWADDYQYSSFTTCMCWVFNQSIIPWICTLLVIKDKKVSDYVLIGMACLLSGSFPFVGLFIYCVAIGIYHFYYCFKTKNIKKFLRDVFSISNILSAAIVFPIVALFLLSNDALNGGGVQLSNQTSGLIAASSTISDASFLGDFVWTYIKFIFVEFLLVSILIFDKYKRNYIYYLTVILLLIFPFFKIGSSCDFSMRASIPSLLILFIMCVSYVFEEKHKNELDDKNITKSNISTVLKKYAYVLLIICLVLGAFTPTVEFYRGFRQVYKNGINDVMTDYIISFDGEVRNGFERNKEDNFVCTQLNDSIFFSYLSK